MAGDARLRALRLALLDDRRRNTAAADTKGGRKLVAEAVRFVQPDAPLGKRLAECGRRNPRNDSREFCEHSACPVCMRRRGDQLFLKRLWPALEEVSPSALRWVTVLMFRATDLDAGAIEADRQLRRLRHILKKFADGSPVRVWGAREVERHGGEWLFHVHMLVDLGGAEPTVLAHLLRAVWGTGERQVQVKPMLPRSHRANVARIAQYMTKARYSSSLDGHHVWWSNEEIAAVALWRDRRSAQWHRFTFGVRMPSLSDSTPRKQLQ